MKTIRCYNRNLSQRYFWGEFETGKKALPFIRRLKQYLGDHWEFKTCFCGEIAREPANRLGNSEFASLVSSLTEPVLSSNDDRVPLRDPHTDPPAHLIEKERSEEPKAPAVPAGLDVIFTALLTYLKPEIANVVERQIGGMITTAIQAELGPRVVHHRVEISHDDTTTVVEGLQHKAFPELVASIAAGYRTFWITGEAGLGKTTAAEKVAEALGCPIFFQGPVVEPYQYFGHLDASGNYHETQLYRWATATGLRVLVLDEIDGSFPNAQLSLNLPLSNGQCVFPHRTVQLDDDAIVIATANTVGDGPNMRYVGRMPADGAFSDRFECWIHWGLDEEFERGIALAKFGDTVETREAVTESQAIRKALIEAGIEFDWTPRRTYAYTRARVCMGRTKAQAGTMAGLSKLDENQRERALS